DKQTVKAPLSEVNLLERSATYLARETARSSCSKTSMTTLLVPAMDALSGAGKLLGLMVRPLNVRGREKKMWLEGGWRLVLGKEESANRRVFDESVEWIEAIPQWV
ncbi:hypothetical protein V8G54_007806, partial [Vigna mungo]